MRRVLGWVAAMAMTLLVAACGGGGNGGTCELCGGDGSGSGSTVSELRLALSSTSISNQNPQTITVTVTAVDSAKVAVSGATVSVASDSGVLTVLSTTTDTAGQVTATLELGSDTTPRTITITATSGSVKGTVGVPVVASASGGEPSLTLALSSNAITSSTPANVTATLLDSAGKPVPSSVVAFASVSGLGTFSAPSALTDSAGQAQVILYPASNASRGADYVQASATVSGVDVSTKTGFSVTPTNVTITSFTSGLGAGRLSAYGQTSLDVTLGGTVSGTPVTLTLSSVCATKSKATLVPATVTTTSGSATFTYRDNQCGATDAADTVTVTVSGSTTSSLQIPLTAPSAGSMGFVSATPEVIYLRGSGLVEVSDVIFVVKDQAGNPLPGKAVTMTPTTMVGGITIDTLPVNGDGSFPTVTKTSDSNGQVSVKIRSGTVPTPVRVKATLVETGAATVSSNLSVAVGLPAQLNFSLSQATINIEGMTRDGTKNTYTVIASDRMGNPVPAGTTVNFVAEGGQIASQGFTAMSNGLASTTVNFQSAEPRPADGRVTILAYALGEESFLDTNGDNVYATGEAYQDLGAVFLSRRYSANYNAARSDQFIKGTDTGACTAVGNPLLNRDASIPSKAASCDGRWSNTGYVRRAAETVFSTSASRLLWRRSAAGQINTSDVSGDLDGRCTALDIVTADDGFTSTTTRFFRLGGVGIYHVAKKGSLSFLVADANDNRLNPMPAGTVVTAVGSDGLSILVAGGTPVANTSEATLGTVTYAFADGTTAGSVTITTTSPAGLASSWTFYLTMDSLTGAACTL